MTGEVSCITNRAVQMEPAALQGLFLLQDSLKTESSRLVKVSTVMTAVRYSRDKELLTKLRKLMYICVCLCVSVRIAI
jgi:hypothetical protein